MTYEKFFFINFVPKTSFHFCHLEQANQGLTGWEPRCMDVDGLEVFVCCISDATYILPSFFSKFYF